MGGKSDFAFVTNKIFVFQSYTFRPKELSREFVSLSPAAPDGGLHSSGHGGYRGCNGLE